MRPRAARRAAGAGLGTFARSSHGSECAKNNLRPAAGREAGVAFKRFLVERTPRLPILA
jgi:hypothetical protein